MSSELLSDSSPRPAAARPHQRRPPCGRSFGCLRICIHHHQKRSRTKKKERIEGIAGLWERSSSRSSGIACRDTVTWMRRIILHPARYHLPRTHVRIIISRQFISHSRNNNKRPASHRFSYLRRRCSTAPRTMRRNRSQLPFY